jgi:hypothetical protein
MSDSIIIIPIHRERAREMERKQLLSICETQIFSFEEFKNFDQTLDHSQVQDQPMEIIVAYGQFKLFLELKQKLSTEESEQIERQALIDWLSQRTASQYKGFDFSYAHSSAIKVKNTELDVKLAYADWDASQAIMTLIKSNPSFCAKVNHSFP